MKKYLLVLFLFLTTLVYAQIPTISQISPTSATGDVIVTIVGTNFTGATSVLLRSAVDAQVPFKVVNPTTILAYVNLSSAKYVNGRQGAGFIITNAAGASSTSPNFNYTVKGSACNSVVYSDWSTCGNNGKQTRTYILSPSTCTTKPPKDSTERVCITPVVRHFKYDANTNTLGIISNVSGDMDITNAAGEVIETYSYDAGPNTVDMSNLPAGDYTASSYGKSTKLSTKFQVAIESSDPTYLVVKGKLGSAPYTYSLNSTSMYVSSLNTVISKSNHIIRCKDATGKIAALTISNIYAGCTLKTTSNTYERNTGAINDIANDSITPVDYSEQYMYDLAAASNNTTTSTLRGGSTRDRTNPIISISSPVNNAVVAGTISVICSASDNVGVKSVTFYIDGTAFTSTPTSVVGSTYTFSWNTSNVVSGVHTIKLTAKDLSNNTASASIQVSKDAPPPIIDITAPSVAWSGTWISGVNVTVGTTYTLTATASDNVGVSSVTFIRDTTVTIGTDATASYTASWNTTGLSLGLHYLKVRAIDAAGNKDSITIVVNAIASSTGDVTPPTVAFTSPWVNGYTLSLPISDAITRTVTMTASDNIAVKKVMFYYNNTLFATDTTAPYAVDWFFLQYAYKLSQGPYTLTAVAYDVAGNTAQANIEITINSTQVGYTSNIRLPQRDTSVLDGDTVSITFNVTAPNGVQSVYLIDPNNSLGISSFVNPNPTSTSFSATFRWPTAGRSGGVAGSGKTYEFHSQVADRLGNIYYTALRVERRIYVYKPAIIVPPLVFTGPSVFNLLAPPVGNQGGEGSCAAWAQGYYQASTRYYYRNNMTSYSYSTNIFSPEYLYNYSQYISPANYGNCANGGSSVLDNNNILSTYGICTWAQMPYTSGTCTTLPNSTQFADAANHKFTNGYVMYNDTVAIKNLLITNHPVLFCVVVDDNFYHAGPGFIWRTLGPIIIASPHAVTCVGYDDSKHAFKVVNSWGTGWGSAGFIYIDYDLLVSGRLVASRLYYLN